MLRYIEYMLVYVVGALLYGLMELLWRGHSHWSMLLCGGLCFTLMYIISMSPMGFLPKTLLCALSISLVEFLTGCVVNLYLGWQVWDYSAMPYNLLGQVCPAFSLMWLALSVPGLALCEKLREFFQ